MKLRNLTIAACVFFLASSPASACTFHYISSASTQQIVDVVENSDLVFVGVVEALVNNPEEYSTAETHSQTVTFDVQKSWKGGASTTVVATANHSSLSCSFPFESGKEYLVVANAQVDGAYRVEFTSLTQPLVDADKVVNALNGLYSDD